MLRKPLHTKFARILTQGTSREVVAAALGRPCRCASRTRFLRNEPRAQSTAHKMAWRNNLQSQPTLTHPPPGWTKTPLFLELSALKEHVAALTDEREKLNAFAQELTERCTSHEDDLGRLRNAFTALAEHVDAEIGRLDGEGRKMSTEASGLQAQIDLP